MNIQVWFPCCPGDSQEFSSTTIWKHQFFGAQPSLWFNSNIRAWLLEKPQLWLYRPLLAKWCLWFFECRVSSQLFHSPLWSSSRSSLVPLHFLPFKWYHLHIWGYWYFSWQLIPACDSSSPAFRMMYCACKLNKQGDDTQLYCTPFPIWNQSVPHPILTVASWPAYGFLRRQVRWCGIPIS